MMEAVEIHRGHESCEFSAKDGVTGIEPQLLSRKIARCGEGYCANCIEGGRNPATSDVPSRYQIATSLPLMIAMSAVDAQGAASMRS